MGNLLEAINTNNLEIFNTEARNVLTEFAFNIGLSKKDFDLINEDSWSGIKKEVSLRTDFFCLKLYISDFCDYNMLYYKCNSRNQFLGGREKKENIKLIFSSRFMDKMIKYKNNKIEAF